jgi:diaminopimelate epimerase
MQAPETIEFHKMHGCGNDFVLIDNRSPAVPVERMSHWAKAVCPRSFSVGADGVIFLEPAPPSPGPEPGPDYVWHFYNADGSRAEMCGNASRCAARLAVRLGLAGPSHVLGTDAGPIQAEVRDDGTVKVQLTPPHGLQTGMSLALEQDRPEAVVHFVNTGVPHAVVVVDDIAGADVQRLGPLLRYHERFLPAGANANFIQVLDRGRIELRTYERGVENETFACGTGAVAALLVARALDLCDAAATVTTTGREVLHVSQEGQKVFLQGRAVHVYTGVLRPADLGLSI